MARSSGAPADSVCAKVATLSAAMGASTRRVTLPALASASTAAPERNCTAAAGYSPTDRIATRAS